LVLLVKPDLCI